MTPEGRVKFQVKQLLKSVLLYYHMPVQNGMGSPTLDFTGCRKGLYYTIETKKPGGKATPRQIKTMQEVERAGGSIFLIDSADCLDYNALSKWLLNPEPGVIGPDARTAINPEAN